MKRINEKQFRKILESEDVEEHYEYQIVIGQPTDIDISKISPENRFFNCSFEGERINFIDNMGTWADDPSQILNFDNCEILNPVYFKDCSLLELSFTFLNKNIENLHISAKNITFLVFKGNRNSHDYRLSITINQTFILNTLEFSDINSTGQLLLHNSNIKETNFRNSNFGRVELTENKFTSNFNFNGTINDTYIKKNIFQNSDFTRTDFGMDAVFEKNIFEGIALFTNLSNRIRTHLILEKCVFKDYSDFNRSTLYKLTIDNCKFLEVSSIQDVELHSMVLDRTIFENLVFFDDLNIIRINKCNQRTIRNIKQQLLRADNKIDYDKFRAYELTSYQETLKKKIKQGNTGDKVALKRDLFILQINHFYSKNGTDWVRAIIITLLIGLFFYTLLFVSINHKQEFMISQYNHYLTGLFRFFLITDFYNPLEDEKVFLQNAFNWLPFLLGKIAIAVGIYEIIVSFRKFKK
jgi:hypothetical protein